MVWQDVMTPSEPGLDADQEQEARLAAQARAGAEWALTALIARYQPPVVRYLTRLTGNPEQARALAERIFIRMERRLHGPHGAQLLRLWLLRACTEAGLDVLRHPRRKAPPRLSAPPAPKALLAERADSTAASSGRLKKGLGKLAKATQSTSRQVRQLIWTIRSETAGQMASGGGSANGASGARNPSLLANVSELDGARDDDLDTLDPREALRHRLVRVVLAELPYGDAQCLALHLVAGLNQAEVAHALGLTASATRRRIVQGLQAFSTRYATALATMGVPAELGYQRPLAPLPDEEAGESAPALAAAAPAYNPLTDMETLHRLDSQRVVESVEQEPTIGRLWPPAAPEPTVPAYTPAAYATPAPPATPLDAAEVTRPVHTPQAAPVADEAYAQERPPEGRHAATPDVPVSADEAIYDTPTVTIPSHYADEPKGDGERDEYATYAAYDISATTHDEAATNDALASAHETLDTGAPDEAETIPAPDWQPEKYATYAAPSVPLTQPAYVTGYAADDEASNAHDEYPAPQGVGEAEPVALQATEASPLAPETPEEETTDVAETAVESPAVAAQPDERVASTAAAQVGAWSSQRERGDISRIEEDGEITQPSLRRIAAAATREAVAVAQADDAVVYRAESESVEPLRPDPALAERVARMQRSGTVSPLARDAIVGPVVDALPVSPTTGPLTPPHGATQTHSTRRPTGQPLTFEMAAAPSPVWITPTPDNGASAGSHGSAESGTNATNDTALAYEAPVGAEPGAPSDSVDQMDRDDQRNGKEKA